MPVNKKKTRVDPGWSANLTAEDNELSRRRYEKYLELSKDYAPFEEILPQLPRDGGTPLPCGCTRFDHLTDEVCPNGYFEYYE